LDDYSAKPLLSYLFLRLYLPLSAIYQPVAKPIKKSRRLSLDQVIVIPF
jgi:hypothetical protein